MISSSTAAEVARGVSRLLLAEGYAPILEFTLPNGRRLDVAAIGPGGEMLGVEIKVALADLRGDGKWPEYLEYCDLFYFAIPPDFPDEHVPRETGLRQTRYIIRGGAVMSMDPAVGDFPKADVLVEGNKIMAVGPNLRAGGAQEIDATGRIVMPGFIDTHHHQFETALRSFLADGILINDTSGSVSSLTTYYEYILLKFAPVYRPQDVYINELFGGLSQLDDGVTTVLDVSQIHHSPQHSDAAIQALFDTGRRAAFGYFESAGGVAGNQYPQDATRIKNQWFASADQLVSMVMGGPLVADDGAGSVGSLMVFEAPDRASVEKFNRADPFFKNGVWAKIEIQRFEKRTG